MTWRGTAALATILLLNCVVCTSSCKNIDTGVLQDILAQSGPLDESTVVAGLKEALQTGTEKSVGTTSSVPVLGIIRLQLNGFREIVNRLVPFAQSAVGNAPSVPVRRIIRLRLLDR